MIGNETSLRFAAMERWRVLRRETVRAGILAGLAMIPFAAFFRARGLRVNEYGRKTLALVVSNEGPTAHWILVFTQHLVISMLAAAPLVWILASIHGRGARIAAGSLYGVLFYVGVNAWALPRLFDDPSPFALGFEVVLPSLVIHAVYGIVLGWVTRPARDLPRSSQ